MITFKKFLLETRMAPLYHATNQNKAIKIFQSGIMKTGGSEPGYPKGTVSLTRNFTFAKMWLREMGDWHQGIIFQIDQQKLTHRHKIVPYSFFGVLDLDMSIRYGQKSNRATRLFPITRTYSKGKDYQFENQFEEAVLSEIKNFPKYVTKIYVVSPEAKPEIFELAKQHNIPIEIVKL